MTRKTVGYVRLEWTCPYCQGRNPGPAKFCMGCGKGQPEDIEFHQPVQEELITDAEEIAQAKAGPDIHCPYCEARNPGPAKFCGNCGGDLSEGAVRKAGMVIGAHRDEVAEPVPCPACGTLNPATAVRCNQCGSNLTVTKEKAKPKATPKERKRSKASTFIIVGLVAVACIVAGVFIALSLIKKDLTGQVATVHWERSIGISALSPVTHEDWLDEIPADAPLGACEEKLHHTQADPAPGAIEVCGTPYTVDTGSGYGEVVQDCEYEVYFDWCEYTVQEWVEVDRVELEGSDLDPQWPGLNLAGDQREGTRTEAYSVVFATDEGDYTYTADDAADFLRFSMGSEWLLEVNALGSLVSVQSAD